jgi:hypothetical protein
MLSLADRMFPCSSMGTVAGILQIESAHTHVGIPFSSHSETPNDRQPYMVDILRGYTRLRSVQSVREALSTFESCSRLDYGASHQWS